MKVELQIQSEVKNILESVQTNVLNNLLRKVREGALNIDEAQLPLLKRVIDASVQQAYTNASGGLSRICSQLETLVNETHRRA